MDEYDSYRPAAKVKMVGLAEEFRRTRAETLALVDRVGPVVDKKVPHNDLGAISVKAWLAYLQAHASRESSKVK
jgi:hypothetical protein